MKHSLVLGVSSNQSYYEGDNREIKNLKPLLIEIRHPNAGLEKVLSGCLGQVNFPCRQVTI